MSESIQTQGKTVNEAVSEALLQLGLRRDEVEIKVIEEPKSGLLGFIGGRPAKVMVRKKPAGRRGRGRDRRSEEKAHSLSGGRGGRGRGAGRSDGNEKDKEPRQEGRGGRGRGGRRGQKPRTDGNEPRAESRGKASGRQRGEPRAAARSDTPAEARNEGRNEPRKDSRGGSRNGRTRRGQQDGRQDNRQDNRQDKQQEARSQNRNDGGAERDAGPTVERRETRGTGRSRRGSRGRGRGRDNQRENQRDNQAPALDEQTSGSVKVVPETAAPERAPEASRNAETSNRKEKTNMTDDIKKTPGASAATDADQARLSAEAASTEAAAPAARAAETPTPVVKPKQKRNGWGGGLGSRLASKANPAVKAKPEKPKAVEVAAPRPAPAAARTDRDGDRARNDFRDQRSASAREEVIVSEVPASKYAKAIGEVTEENLDASLSELTSGMLARAGFPCDVEVLAGEYRQVRIASDDESAGLLIGRHGQTVDAVEHLVERMASNAVDDRVRMNLDINEYRRRRQDSLAERVADAVAQVRESGKAYHVEPMSARERRLVHLEVEPLEDMKTFTMVGSGGKYVVIAQEEEPETDAQNDD